MRHHESLISTGARPMFEQDKVEDLGRMFTLFSRCPETLKSLHVILRECIKDAAKAILSDAEKQKEPVAFIDALLSISTTFVSSSSIVLLHLHDRLFCLQSLLASLSCCSGKMSH